MFKPIKRKRLYAEVMEQIQQLIVDGKLKPGDKLTSERELAEKLEVSRSSVREAFSALDLMGILESRPGEGTFVRTVPADEAYKPLTIMLMLEQKSSCDVLEVRKILESESAFLAAERATEEHLSKMEACLSDMEADLKEGRDGETPDACFHFAVVESTQNKVMEKLMHAISDLVVFTMKLSRQKMLMKPENQEKLCWQHKQIFEAIAAKEPDLARSRMCEHLSFVSDEIFYFEQQN